MRIRILLHQLGRDVRDGLRQVRRNPAFSAIAIATLALGIGANTAMFSAVDAVLIRPLPYADAGRLVMIWDDMRQTDSNHFFPRPPNGPSGGGRTQFSPISRQRNPATPPCPATASPKQVPARKVTANLLERARRQAADRPRLHRRTKTSRARGSPSSATDCGSGASAGRPMSWAARSRSTTTRTKSSA